MDLNDNLKGLPANLRRVIAKRGVTTIEGKGSISIKDDKSIDITIYIQRKENFDSKNYLNSLLNSHKDAGKIVGDDAYFEIEAESMDGDLYYCDRVAFFDLNDPDVISGQLKSHLIITDDITFTDYHIGKVVIPYEVKIPKNKAIEINRNYSTKWRTRNIAVRMFETSVAKIDINIMTEHEKTIILIQSKSQLFKSQNDIEPIIDSLSFIVSVAIDRYDIELANHKTRKSKRIFCPKRMIEKKIPKNHEPLNLESFEEKDYHVELFNRFFLFRQKRESNDLMKTLKEVIESSNSYVNVYSLTLTTSIEQLVKTYYSTKTKQLPSEVIHETKRLIEETNINDQIKARIIGLLNSILGQIRAKDILVELKENNTINKKEYEAWTELRNASTHGDKIEKSFQEIYDLCATNLVLYNKLIFDIIQYQGSYTDYSQYGHPNLKIRNNEA